MQDGKTPKGARVVALDANGSPKSNGTTPFGFVGSNGVRLVDIFDQLHAGVRDVRRRLEVNGLTSDEMFEAFNTLVAMYECLVTMAAWIETRPR